MFQHALDVLDLIKGHTIHCVQLRIADLTNVICLFMGYYPKLSRLCCNNAAQLQVVTEHKNH